MQTEVKIVLVADKAGATKEIPIRTDDNNLMKRRLDRLLREYPNISADKRLGKELLAQATELHGTLIAMQEINRTTESEVAHVRKKISQDEAFYLAIFGQLPVSYLDGTPIQ
ncbi:MAG: hypothetical protein ACK5MU_00960 [Candidatus Saccharimonadales bacterium]